jgi:mannose-6-phosphate isomerase-like protein (cupin superfamily)
MSDLIERVKENLCVVKGWKSFLRQGYTAYMDLKRVKEETKDEGVVRSLRLQKSEMHFVPKGWGWERWMLNDSKVNYCMKEIFIAAGKCGSFHMHLKKDETMYVRRGKVQLVYMEEPCGVHSEKLPCEVPSEITCKQEVLSSGDSIRFKPKVGHRFTAITDTIIIEVSTYHAEEDVVRFSPGDLLPGVEFKEINKDAAG